MKGKFIIVGFLLTLLGCGTAETLESTVPLTDSEVPADSPVEDSREIYATFTLNTQEFIRYDLSQGVIARVVELHEKFQTPLDVFFADFLVQELDETGVIQGLAQHELVAISYHTRLPVPYANGGKASGFDYEDYMNYETHTIDPTTGELTDEPGAYAYLKELLGYAPFAVGIPTPEPELIEVYGDLGAQFAVSHDQASYELGETIGALQYRPETVEIRLFELTIEEMQRELDELLSQPGEEPIFINFKLHDKDFFADASAWTLMYVHKKPPYLEQNYHEEVNYLSEEEQNEVWAIYEAALQYVEDHEAITPLNLRGISELNQS